MLSQAWSLAACGASELDQVGAKAAPPVPSEGVPALPSILFSIPLILAWIDGHFPASVGQCCPAGQGEMAFHRALSWFQHRSPVRSRASSEINRASH